MSIALYHANHSTCSQKVRICLAEKGLEYESRLVNLGTDEHLDPEYLKINPNGVVPTLIHDGRIIIDSSVILEYLDEAFPEPPLIPSDIHERARMRAWMRYLEEVPTAAVRVPSFNMAFLDRFEGMTEEEFLAIKSDKRPLRRQFYRRMGTDGFRSEEVDASFDQLRKTARRMDEALADGPWLLGDFYSLADIVVAPLIDRMDDLGYAELWEDDCPRVTDWYARMQARPAFQTAFYPKSRLSEFMTIGPIEGKRGAA